MLLDCNSLFWILLFFYANALLNSWNMEWFYITAVAEENLLASDQPDMVSRFLKIMKVAPCNPTILFLIICGLYLIHRQGLIIPIFLSCFTGRIQLEISSQSSSCERSTTGLDMKFPQIQKMRSCSNA